MKTAEGRAGLAGRKNMGYLVRPMRLEDIHQVAVTERECFPTGWTPTPFRRELQAKNAAYLVACKASDPGLAHQEATALPDAVVNNAPSASPLVRLVRRVRDALKADGLPLAPGRHHIAGYVGLWFIVDEAHITAIGVRESERRNGIGELLLLASIEAAMRRGSRVVTLETRVSNIPAQRLYEKYGFEQAGLRKAYYVDNREDALIMTTDILSSPRYREVFQLRLREHAQRWGDSVRYLG